MIPVVSLPVSTVQSINEGNWLDSSTWSGGNIPIASDHVLIESDHIVECSGDCNAASIIIEGSLVFLGGKLSVHTIYVMDSGRFEAGNDSAPVTGEIVFVPGVLDIPQVNGGLVSMGIVKMCGVPKAPWVWLSINPEAGDMQLLLSIAPLNWQVGDILHIPSVNRGLRNAERIPIKSINGKQVFLESALQFNHLPPPNVPIQIPVANLSRSLTVKSVDLSARAHVMFMGMAAHSVDICDVQFKDLGRTNKMIRATDDPNASPRNQRGRYAFHFHEGGVELDHTISRIERCAVVNSNPSWGIVVHGTSNVELSSNVVVNSGGAAVVYERGDEITGKCDNNYISEITSSGEGHKDRYDIDDWAHHGCGIYMQGSGPPITNNVISDIKFKTGSVEDLHAGILYLMWAAMSSGGKIIHLANVPEPWQTYLNPRKLNPLNVMVRTTDPPIFASGNTIFACGIGVWYSYPQFATTPIDLIGGTIWGMGPTGVSRSVGVYAHYVEPGIGGKLTIDGVKFYGYDFVGNRLGIAIYRHNGRADSQYYKNCLITGWNIGTEPVSQHITVIENCNFDNCRVAVRVAYPMPNDPNIPGHKYVEVKNCTFTRCDWKLRCSEFPDMQTKKPQLDNLVETWFENSFVIVDGEQIWFKEQEPSYIPFNNVSPLLNGLTNQQLLDQHSLALMGSLTSSTAVIKPQLFYKSGVPVAQSPYDLISQRVVKAVTSYQPIIKNTMTGSVIKLSIVTLNLGLNVVKYGGRGFLVLNQ